LRQEDKEVDGRDLERAERLEQSELEAKDEEELPAQALDQVRELARTQRAELLAMVHAIFARDHLVLDTLKLPQHELRALEALKAAVDGRDAQLAQFVYATDRRELLEQALAVLQPNLELDDPTYVRLVDEVRALRAQLANLVDAQDELIEFQGEHVKAAANADDQDDDASADAADTERAAAPAQATPSTLYGPERPVPPRAASALDGPERPAPPRAASTLAGPEPPAPPSEGSTLYGPEDAPTPTAPSTLGDASEIASAHQAQAPRKPWWKRPFG
jgi:hypothetical protein